MPVRFYRSILFPLLLLCAGLPLSAQAAPTNVQPKTNIPWFRIAGQSDWVAGLPAGSVVAWGDGVNFSNAVTTTATLFPASGFEATAAQFGVAGGLNGSGGLYVQEGAAAVTFSVAVFPAQVSTSITVPAIAAQPPPPPTQPTPSTLMTLLLGLLQSPTAGVENQGQLTCSLTPATLPPGVVLPVYGTPPLYCVFAIIQVAVPVVPPAPAAASK